MVYYFKILLFVILFFSNVEESYNFKIKDDDHKA